jgi:phosphatidate cytidylyltransferase
MGETGKRIISGVLMASIFIASFNINIYAGLPLFLVMLILSPIALTEFYTLTKKDEDHAAFKKTGFVLGWALIILTYFHNLKDYLARDGQAPPKFLQMFELGYSSVFSVFFIGLVILLSRQLTKKSFEGTVYSASITLTGVIYTSLIMCHLLLLQQVDGGVFYIWMIGVATTMSDSMAYAAGKTLGKNKIGMPISPNKTYEGYILGFIGQVIITLTFYYTFSAFSNVPELGFFNLLVFCIIMYVASVLGDLSESLLKRNYGHKDSGKFIPGHGGALDVIDALIFTIPLGYYYLTLLNHLSKIYA